MTEASKLRCGLQPTVESWQEDPMGPTRHCLAPLSCPQPLPSLCRAFALAAPPAPNSRKGLPHTLAPASKLEKGQISLPVELRPTALTQLQLLPTPGFLISSYFTLLLFFFYFSFIESRFLKIEYIMISPPPTPPRSFPFLPIRINNTASVFC